MTSVFQLYGRPLAANTPLPPLRITGDLEAYTIGEPYEGRLQIIDSIGKCVVEIVASSLPPGSYAFVDNFTKEIVLRWPAYAPPDAMASGVPNGDFELGDNGMWNFGAGWSIQSGGAETGTYSGVFANQRGISSIESVRVPYTPGTPIHAAVRFQQGASSEGNLVGRILLIWCDANGNMLPGGEGVSFDGGNLIRSGSNGAWKTSEVTASSEQAATVAVGFSADRNKQNRPCRVDNFTWDHQYPAGTDSELEFTVTFKVTDSANRIAYWTGRVGIYTLLLTSKLYAVELQDALLNSTDFTRVKYEPDMLVEDLAASVHMMGVTLQSTVVYSNYDYGIDKMKAGASFRNLKLTQATQYATYNMPQEDNISGRASFIGATMEVVVEYRTYDIGIESIQAGATFRGVTLS